jgi:alpha 1,3-glucosidase
MLLSTARSTRGGAFFLFLSILFCLLVPVEMVKHENFKTCNQSGFCKRNRAFADSALATDSTYSLDPASIKFNKGKLTGTILKKISEQGETVRLPLTIAFLESGTARVTIDEERRQKGDIVLRHDSTARKERYNEAEKWAIVGGLDISKGAVLGSETEKGTTKVVYGPGGSYEAVIRHAPFGAEFKRDGVVQIKMNERGYLNLEHWRAKVEKPKVEIVEEEDKKEDGKDADAETKKAEEKPKKEDVNEHEDEETGKDESTWWEESFGGNTDSKPRGPESVGLDITFINYEHVYGIPEHASSMSLKETRGGDGKYSEPYRMFNADVFEYELDSPMTLYGAIPFMQAHRKDSTVGIFWLNAAEMWVDIVKEKTTANPLSLGIGAKTDTKTHWFAESGLLDFFVFLGPSPRDVIKSYGELTGYTELPQHFAIAYHQCRWNYVTDQDVMDVDRKFDKNSIPFDVIWLDIEYTDGKKYFTFDPLTFPNPQKMLKQLDAHERKLVAIIDPHIKNEGKYHVVEELKKKDLAVKNKKGEQYEGWCWPGSSYWIDCFNPAAIDWWKSLFKYDKFVGTAKNTFIWNDMNEPSVFNGPETSMPRDNLHHGNWEHRDVHNLNGMTFHNATYQALVSRAKGEMRRPFVLTRAFYAGSQRSAAMWTGDNLADWNHLQAAIPMILNNGISGFPFAGADVGGFFGNPSWELLTRWYQSGVFYPFFRAHAHIDTRRREPYLAGDPYKTIITQALRLRYSLLPAWYTAFYEASVNGTPIVRPNFFEHPQDEAGFGLDDQLYVGNTGLLAKPVVTEGADFVDVHLADDTPYYDYADYKLYTGPGSRRIHAPLDKIPLLMRGGHIIPRRDRPRRSSGLMRHDPLTLVVVLNNEGTAEGSLYMDDGDSFEYREGGFLLRKFRFLATTNELISEDARPTRGKKTDAYLKTVANVRVEKVIVVGAPRSWKGVTKVSVTEEGAKQTDAALTYVQGAKGKADYAIVKDPGASIAKGWRILFQ